MESRASRLSRQVLEKWLLERMMMKQLRFADDKIFLPHLSCHQLHKKECLPWRTWLPFSNQHPEEPSPLTPLSNSAVTRRYMLRRTLDGRADASTMGGSEQQRKSRVLQRKQKSHAAEESIKPPKVTASSNDMGRGNE